MEIKGTVDSKLDILSSFTSQIFSQEHLKIKMIRCYLIVLQTGLAEELL